jgi:hypothetical protein
MDKHGAIAASCVFIGFAVLTQTGYAVYHDRDVAEGQQRQREAVAKATTDAAKLSAGKAAWLAATRDLSVQLGIWRLIEEVKTKKVGPLYGTPAVKVYANSDITWHDARSVTVKGYLISAPITRPKSMPAGDIREYFTWSRDLVLLDDDTWRARSLASFGINGTVINPASVPKAERDAMFTTELRP